MITSMTVGGSMHVGYDIFVDLLSAAIGATASALMAYCRKTFKYRRRRAFWRFLDKPTVIVVGDLAPEVLLGNLPGALKDVADTQQGRILITEKIINFLHEQEISGIIGRGDLGAIAAIMARLVTMRIPTRPLVLHPSQVRDRRDHNLILIGGNDTNSMTCMIAPRLGCQLESLINNQGHNVVRDSRLDVDHPVTWQRIPKANGEILHRDYGILARGPNPYNPEREVLLLAGAHGLGSLAAAEVCLRAKFERRLYNDLRQFNGAFECLVSYQRLDGGPDDGKITIELEFSRGLRVPLANQ
jgi:hypothetical protein